LYNYSKKDLDKAATETGFIRDNLEKTFNGHLEDKRGINFATTAFHQMILHASQEA
jgi:hypothetical protein